MNALKYKYQQGIQELIQDGMPASEITPYYQTIRRYNHKKLWRMIGIPICVISIIFVFVLTSINILKESLLEIWNKQNWEKFDENISVDEIAENMTMLGI